MDKPEFAKSLYDYLNNIDISHYSFPTERLKVLTETYKEMARKQLYVLCDVEAALGGITYILCDVWVKYIQVGVKHW